MAFGVAVGVGLLVEGGFCLAFLLVDDVVFGLGAALLFFVVVAVLLLGVFGFFFGAGFFSGEVVKLRLFRGGALISVALEELDAVVVVVAAAAVA